MTDLQLSLVALEKERAVFWFGAKDRSWGKVRCCRCLWCVWTEEKEGKGDGNIFHEGGVLAQGEETVSFGEGEESESWEERRGTGGRSRHPGRAAGLWEVLMCLCFGSERLRQS